MRRSIPLAGVLLALVAVLMAGAGAATGRSPHRSLRVGTLVLHRCADGYPGFCGRIRRALDPGLRGGPTIPIGFEWIPARGPAPRPSTVVAVEGGPGYPSSGSYEEYTGTFGRVLSDHNLLMVDNRGTGRSALIRCPSLDRYPPGRPAVGRGFDRLVGACADHLDHLYRGPDGRFIHAAGLFATEYAVNDLAAVLGRLRTGRVTLYGDSYGSWFAQAFMARHPHALRAVILDSTYAIHDLDPYYASSGSSGRAALDRVCARSPDCRHEPASGTPVSRLARLLRRVRRHPIRGSVAVPGGRRSISVTPRRLVDLFQDAGSDAYVARELDPTVASALVGDTAPLARLALYDDDNGGDADPGYFSDGDYMAVSCTDYPQLFSMRASPAVRARELARHVRAAPPGAFAPFTAAEWVTMSGYSETYDACLDWPAPVHRAPVLAPVGRRRLPASVPVLVVGGDLDDLTPLHDARRFAPGLGRTVRVVDLRNTVHVTSEGDTFLSDGAQCARQVIDRFVADPFGLRELDTGCAARIPPLQTPDYPRTLDLATPARVTAGPALGTRTRRAVSVAAGALADVTIRRRALDVTRGVGLDGGRWRVRDGRFELVDVRLVPDATVSGVGRYRAADGLTTGRLRVRGPGIAITVDVRFTQRSRAAVARVGATALALPAP